MFTIWDVFAFEHDVEHGSQDYNAVLGCLEDFFAIFVCLASGVWCEQCYFRGLRFDPVIASGSAAVHTAVCISGKVVLEVVSPFLHEDANFVVVVVTL